RPRLLGVVVRPVHPRVDAARGRAEAVRRPGRVHRGRYEGLLGRRARLAEEARHHVSERARRQRQRPGKVGRAADSAHLLRRTERQSRRRADRRGGPAALSAADCSVMKRLLPIVLFALLLVQTARASERHPTLAELEGEVMCPVCETTLDQSSSPAAQQIKRLIATRIAAGDTKTQIKDRLVAEYGSAILAAPPHKGFGLVAWWLPVAGIVAAAAVVGAGAWRWSRAREREPDGPQLDPVLERRIDDELAHWDP